MDTSSGIQNRKQQMARALALLVITVGILLLLIGWLFQQNAPTDRYPQLADTDAAGTDIPRITPPASLPSEPKPEPQSVTASIPPAEVTPETKPTIEPAIASPTTNTQASLQDKPVAEEPLQPLTDASTISPASEPETKPEQPPPEQNTVPDNKPEPPPSEQNTTKENSQSGWIYGGQFHDGKWVERGLVIGEELPVSGKSYTLNWGANIRPQPPGKNTTLAETVGYLPQGKTVDILQVKKSGSKGHIWLEIKR